MSADFTLSETSPATSPDDTSTPRKTRGARIAKAIGWTTAFLALLLAFTLAKLPDDRIGALVLGKASEILSSGGRPIEVSAEKTAISLLLARIRFEGLQLKTQDLAGSAVSVRWKELRIRPSLLDLLLLRLGGSAWIQGEDDSQLSLSFWTTRNGVVSAALDLNKADLGGKGLGVLPLLAGVDGSVPLDGKAELTGDLSQTDTIRGTAQLKLGKLRLPTQKLMGFPIPRIQIDDGEIRISAESGKARIETFSIGRLDRESDDIRSTLSGEVTLGRTFPASQLNLKARLKFSSAFQGALFLIDGLLGPGKQPDGSYSLLLTGPIQAPQIQPAGGGP